MSRARAHLGGTRALAAVAAVALGSPAAAAGDAPAPDDLASRWWREISRRIEAAVAAKPTPPVPVEVAWGSRRLASVDLGAPLLALAAGDLDGNGTAELVALTTEEVLALRREGRRKLRIVARTALPDAPAAQRSRDPVGALAVDDTDGDGEVEVLARSSEQSIGAVWALRGGSFERLRELDAFPLCGAATARLHPGRNYFDAASLGWTARADRPALPQTFYDARCTRDLVDPRGVRYALFGVAGTDGTLAVQRLVTCGAAPCRDQPIDLVEIRNRGAAFALADVDNDGHAEIIATTNRPPGHGDRVSVYSYDGAEPRRVTRSKKFTGGVAGVAVGDLDGDGDRDVVAAVRLVGSNKVDVWTLTQ